MKRLVLILVIATVMAIPAWAGTGLMKDVTDTSGTGDPGNGKGAAFADVDNDGDWDLYISNKGGANRLMINDGKGVFTDATGEAGEGLDDAGFAMGSVFFDFDNDGWVDLYVPKGGRYEIEANRLFKNVDGKFVDVTDKAGVGSKEFTYAAAAADYNNDGFIDLYLANYGVGAKNILYRNNGNGTFTDVTDTAGVGDRSWSWMAVWADVNNDGAPDLYVINGRYPAGEPNTLYINDGKGKFTSEGVARGVSDSNWGLGAAFADTDSDGDLDLFVSNYVGANGYYVNDGAGNFPPAAQDSGLANTGWGKGPTFGDIDHDGDLDLYEGDCKVANQLYRNNGDGTFSDIAQDNEAVMCSSVRTKGTSFADIDNDGDLDLYVVNWGAPNKMFLNTTNDANWIKVRLSGTISNSMAIGSRVWVREGERLVGMADLQTSSGFCAQPPQELHFGASSTSVYTVEVRFPSGARKIIEGVQTGQTLTIEEPGEVAAR